MMNKRIQHFEENFKNTCDSWHTPGEKVGKRGLLNRGKNGKTEQSQNAGFRVITKAFKTLGQELFRNKTNISKNDASNTGTATMEGRVATAHTSFALVSRADLVYGKKGTR